MFSQKVLQTRYTPSKLQVNPVTNHLMLIEKDHGCPTLSERTKLKQSIAQTSGHKEYAEIDFQKVGYPKTDSGFASCFRIVDPFSFETVFLQEFEN